MKIKTVIYFIIVVCSFLYFIGCESQSFIDNRSGTLEDDYIEEPVSERSKEFRAALELSNSILEGIKNKQQEELYQEHFSEELKKQISLKEFLLFIKQLYQNAGPIKNYKKLQWAFYLREENGRKILYSVKIVEHEKIMLRYYFVFNHNDYTKIIGFHTKTRTRTVKPGQM